MLGQILSDIVVFWYDRKGLFFLGLLLMLSVLGFGLTRLQINESIFSLLPKGDQFEQFNKLIRNKKVIDQVVFSVKVPIDAENDQMRDLVLELADSLEAIDGSMLADVVPLRSGIDRMVYRYYYENLPAYLDSAYYAEMDERLQPSEVSASIEASYKRLLTPGGAMMKEVILNDPLYLSASFFEHLNKESNDQGFQMDDGVVYSKDRSTAIVTAITGYDTKDSKQNTILYEKLKALKFNWDQAHTGYELEHFGTFEIAAENAIQVKRDTFVTLLITLLLVLGLLVGYYRNILMPIYFMIPVGFGGLFALGMMGYIKPEVNGISLATGAVLMGIILDYSFHFFTHLRHTGSIKETIKDVSTPMLIGSFTTITAFFALIFANSVILQDFGLFAALSLSGAAIFTLTCLPVILKVLKFNPGAIPNETSRISLPGVPDKWRGKVMIGIVVLTGVFLYTAQFITFDDELDNLSYHPEELVGKEQAMAGLNPKEQKKVYLFSSADNIADAELANFRLYQSLRKLKAEGKVVSFVSSAPYLVPDAVKQQQTARWKSFWAEKYDSTMAVLSYTADSLGFSSAAFDGFKQWVKDPGNGPTYNSEEVLAEMGLDALIEHSGDSATIISTVVIDEDKLVDVRQQLVAIEGVDMFDRSSAAASLLDIVQRDFNYILWVSSLIVFVTLLLIYGRIELALMAFLPMVISWIWILGIAGLFGIKFNIVNVVIATFIFGLGDDFSIFVTDGLLGKYKYNKDSLGSYKAAIMLSAITTMIGTGVLYFAKHPAIHSISVISVLGIACILLVSLVFQPMLFQIFVSKPIKNGKPPVSAVPLLISLFEFPYFALGCILIMIIAVIMIVFRVSDKNKRSVLNFLMSKACWSVIYSSVHVKKRQIDRHNLDLSKPSIMIANHSSMLDILLMAMLSPKVIIMVKDWVYYSPLFGFVVRNAGYVFSETGSEKSLDIIKERIAEGYSILIYPEGTRSPDGNMRRFHKGAFYLADELGLDITPVLIHGASYTLTKGEFYVKRGSLNLKFLPRIKADDENFGVGYKERTQKISAYFKEEHDKFTADMETPEYLLPRIMNNYIFKGPVLEWYVRIKWKLEAANYVHYDKLIGDRKRIVDVGCGYGYLSLYLHYRNNERVILGLDYDEEKVEVAQNCFDKGDQVYFDHADIKTFDLDKADVILLSDVLHYLSAENQQLVLQRCCDALNDNGLILIRDGITDLGERHDNTKLTELFSTKIMGFNKKEEEFHFFSSDTIRQFAEKNGLSYDMQDRADKTSNVLFVLQK